MLGHFLVAALCRPDRKPSFCPVEEGLWDQVPVCVCLGVGGPSYLGAVGVPGNLEAGVPSSRGEEVRVYLVEGVPCSLGEGEGLLGPVGASTYQEGPSYLGRSFL